MAGRISTQPTAIYHPKNHHHSSLCSLSPSSGTKVSLRFSLGSRLYSSLKLTAISEHPSKTVASAQYGNTMPSQDVIEIWRNADVVCFDVDSTVCIDEGIDELADFCGAGESVAEWTARAMGGSVPFEVALAARLSLFKPSLSQVQDFLERRPPRISPGIHDLINKLRAKKAEIYLISGGFRQMIEVSNGLPLGSDFILYTCLKHPVAAQLGIPRENIFANRLLFRSSGEFDGFDEAEPTSRSGGKASAIRHIKKVHQYRTLVMVGDGATDLEARKPGGADLFICYGGIQLRPSVAAAADWLVLDFNELCAGLE
ncbi:3-phosphoserine phosphatase [Wolffia australiana]